MSCCVVVKILLLYVDQTVWGNTYVFVRFVSIIALCGFSECSVPAFSI